MKSTCASFILLLSVLLSSAQPSYSVRFDQQRYDIAPGDTFPVRLLIDPVPGVGLHSFGVSLAFDPTHTALGDVAAIAAAAPLDFNGVRGPGAIKAASSGRASVKGTIDGSAQPTQFYSQATLATFSVTDLAHPGPYSLTAGYFNTLGPTEQIFVDGLGNVLDSQITFAQALVNYRPTVTLTAPTGGAVFQLPANIALAADAQDLDGTVGKVEFFDGDAKIGEAGSVPFQFSWSNSTPGPHSLKAVATDNLGAQTTSTSVDILIKPPNSPPVLGAIGDKAVDEETLLTFTATATDPDVPGQTLVFGLATGAPSGAAIDPVTGVFRWTPTEAQGPGVYPITVVVTDNGSPPKSDSEKISITVREVNRSPVLGAIGDKIVNEGTLLTFTAIATDPDLPSQKLTFSLDSGAPPGAAIDSASGVFTWNPTDAQAGKTHTLTVRVADDGSPPLNDSETIHITVVPKLEPYAIFAGQANQPVGSKVINFNGSASQTTGKIHSNSDIDVSGNKHGFHHGDVEYVTGITPSPAFGGKVTLDDAKLVASTVKAYPVDYQLAQFAPGGASATEAQAVGKYFHIKGDSNLNDYTAKGALREGLYFVEGKLHLSGHGLTGKVTLVATDEINISASDAAFSPYSRCLLAFSSKQSAGYSKPVASLSGSGNQWRGIIFAPNGGIEISGAGNAALVGSLVGLGVTVTGDGFQLVGVDLETCEPGETSAAALASLVSRQAASSRARLEASVQGRELEISFVTEPGQTYTVEYADSVVTDSWTDLAVIPGDGNLHSVRTEAALAQRFYRLRLTADAAATRQPAAQ